MTCQGCKRKMPIHAGIHCGEVEMISCTQPALSLEPMTNDTWHRPEKKIKGNAPFSFK